MRQLILRFWWLGLLVAGAAAVPWLPTPDFLKLKEVVVVTPPTRLSETELVRLTELEKGKNLLTLSLGEVRKKLLRFPWLEEVALAKTYPGRLVISVKEYEPVALAKLDGLYLVNPDGVVFKKIAAGDPRDFPILTGLERKPTRQRLAPLIGLLGDFQKREPLRMVGLSEIHWDPAQGVSLFTLRPVVKVVLGKERWAERLDKLVQILPSVATKQRAPQSIDLTYEKRIFVKQKT